MHYEIEQVGLGREHGPDVGTHADPAGWHVVSVFNADAVPMPLTFEALQQALDYVHRTPGTLRGVEGGDERGRVPVEGGCPCGGAGRPRRTTRPNYASRPRETAGPTRRGGRSGG